MKNLNFDVKFNPSDPGLMTHHTKLRRQTSLWFVQKYGSARSTLRATNCAQQTETERTQFRFSPVEYGLREYLRSLKLKFSSNRSYHKYSVFNLGFSDLIRCICFILLYDFWYDNSSFLQRNIKLIINGIELAVATRGRNVTTIFFETFQSQTNTKDCEF